MLSSPFVIVAFPKGTPRCATPHPRGYAPKWRPIILGVAQRGGTFHDGEMHRSDRRVRYI